jgi:hypothetical protein
MEGTTSSSAVVTDNGSQATTPRDSDQGHSDSRRSRHHESSDDEDDDDRNFKHRRQRSEPRDDEYRPGDKRRHDESDSNQINKYMRDSQGGGRVNNGMPQDSRGRGRGAARGRGGRPRPLCRDYNGTSLLLQFSYVFMLLYLCHLFFFSLLPQSGVIVCEEISVHMIMVLIESLLMIALLKPHSRAMSQVPYLPTLDVHSFTLRLITLVSFHSQTCFSIWPIIDHY